MRKKFILLGLIAVFLTPSLAAFASYDDATNLLIRENETQVRMNQYEVSKQLYEQKANMVRTLTQMDATSTKTLPAQNIIQTRRQRDARMYGKSYSKNYMLK